MNVKSMFYACVAAVTLFASCQKDKPGAETAPSDMTVITATAIQTKTISSDRAEVLWENGDAVLLRAHLVETEQPVPIRYTTTLQTPTASATFSRDASEEHLPTLINNQYVALYPADITYTNWSKSASVYVAAEINQEVETTGWDRQSALMIATSENTDFVFRHIVSYIRFVVNKDTTPFNKITVSSADENQEVISRINVSFNGEYAFQRGKAQCSKSLTFTKSDKSAFGPGTYYIAINPDTYAKGLRFTFENGTSTHTEDSADNLDMKPGDVADLGAIGALWSTKLGSVYSENGVNQGVVFWVNEDATKGKVISGAVTKLVWGNGTAKTYSWASAIDTDKGLANHNYVLKLSGSKATEYPAVYFCENLDGDGWHLPTVKDMQDLATTYYGLEGKPELNGEYYGKLPHSLSAVKFDTALGKCVKDDPATEGFNESSINVNSNSWYWTGQGDKSSQKIRNVKFAVKYYAQTASATSSCYVRCVREVEF